MYSNKFLKTMAFLLNLRLIIERFLIIYLLILIYDEILKEGYEENKRIKKKFLRQEEQRLLNRLSKYKENHIKFLKDFTVPFDNNLSEKDLSNVKIKQKISWYFSNLEQATNFFNIKSIIMTLKKQGKDFYSEIYKKYEKNPINA